MEIRKWNSFKKKTEKLPSVYHKIKIPYYP